MGELRVDQLRRDFYPTNPNYEQYPAELVDKVGAILWGAGIDKDESVFTTEEAGHVDSSFPDLFASWGGAMRFTEAILQGPRLLPDLGKTEIDAVRIAALYHGLKSTSPKEPSFLLDNVELKKVGSKGALQELMVNGRLFVLVGEDFIRVKNQAGKIETFTSFADASHPISLELKKLVGEWVKVSPDDIEGALLKLPFLEGVPPESRKPTSVQYNDASTEDSRTFVAGKVGEVQWRENSYRSSIPLERTPLYMDGFGRYFTEEVKGSRVYVKGPKVVLEHKDKESRLDIDKTASVLVGVENVTHGLANFSSVEEYLPMARFTHINPNGGGAGCFAPETLLLTSWGYLTFSDLYEKYRAGKELPMLASFNWDKGVVEYQRPLRISQSYLDPEGRKDSRGISIGLKKITFLDDSGSSVIIKPTRNHFFAVRRNQKDYYVHAANIQRDEQLLLNREGEIKLARVKPNFFPLETLDSDMQNRPAEGGQDVYNIAFGENQHHNYILGSGALVHNFTKMW